MSCQRLCITPSLLHALSTPTLTAQPTCSQIQSLMVFECLLDTTCDMQVYSRRPVKMQRHYPCDEPNVVLHNSVLTETTS
ncbi:hypothetical protein EV126DRAFT_413853 [Verticillium dahliae]|nr:hypothetical protein EV126DRAFT_413853 [Verticillium dahliae]